MHPRFTSPCSRRTRARAFTLVELLIVIAIIGVLVALLLPAVQAAREAARRSQCSNNFKQIALGLLNFENSQNTLPRGMKMWQNVADPALCGQTYNPGDYFFGMGWGVLILPFIEEQALYNKFDFNINPDLSQSPNFQSAAHRLNVFLCPSDPQDGELCNYMTAGQNGTDPEEDLRQTNVVGIADSAQWLCDTIWVKEFPASNGVFGNLGACRLAHIRDGLSNTLLLGEVTGGGPGTHRGHFWSTFALTDVFDGINGPWTLPGGQFTHDADAVIWGFRTAGPSSFHGPGCLFAFADGSVHFLSDEIAKQTLDALATRAGREGNGNIDF